MVDKEENDRVIWIVRHGARLDFEDPGWSAAARRPHDPPLSPRGLREAEQIARRLSTESVSHIFSSPFFRTLQTADVLARELLLPIKVEKGLAEWLNREWFPEPPEILSTEESLSQFPRIEKGYRSRGSAVYGESGHQALKRSGETARRLASDFPEDCVLVGHGASVLGATVGLLGIPPSESGAVLGDMPYGCLVKLVQRDHGWQLVLPCDTSHLETTGL
jgi:broad specificity phosphatase PhoE